MSSTLAVDDVGADRVRLMPELSVADLRRIVDDATGVVEIFGPTTAAPAIRAGMVEEFQFFVVPKTVGGGLRALPDDRYLSLMCLRIFRAGLKFNAQDPAQFLSKAGWIRT